MALLHQIKRVNLEDGEWVDVRPLSVRSLREMRKAVAEIEERPGETKEEAQGFELTRMALEATIVGWSDPDPVTPENIGELPYKVTFDIANAIGLGEEERPLPSGSDSTATLVESQEESSQTNG